MTSIETNKQFSTMQDEGLSERRLLHLPPARAFKNPNDWLRPLAPAEKIMLPTDDRGFVRVDNAIDRLLDEFNPSYEWEYMPEIPESKPDAHHVYHFKSEYAKESERLREAGVKDWMVPLDFRRLPTNIVTIPGLLHNFLHHATHKPQMPDYEPMQEYLAHYRLAHGALTRTYNAAEGIDAWEKIQQDRAVDVSKRPYILPNPDETDFIGMAIINSRLEKYFTHYALGLQALHSVETLDIVMPGKEINVHELTREQVIKLGRPGKIRDLTHRIRNRIA